MLASGASQMSKPSKRQTPKSDQSFHCTYFNTLYGVVVLHEHMIVVYLLQSVKNDHLALGTQGDQTIQLTFMTLRTVLRPENVTSFILMLKHRLSLKSIEL